MQKFKTGDIVRHIAGQQEMAILDDSFPVKQCHPELLQEVLCGWFQDTIYRKSKFLTRDLVLIKKSAVKDNKEE